MFEQIEFNTSVSEPIDTDVTVECNKGRIETREVEVYDDLYGIDTTNDWIGLKVLLKITRKVESKSGKEDKTKEVAYYICSNDKLSAKEFNYGIRSHWSIENSLHYVKDVTFKEDESKIHKGNAPEIFSIVRNFAINGFRRLKTKNFKSGIRRFCGKIKILGSVF